MPINGSTSTSHLIYVDDILIFSKANPKLLGAIKHILYIFSTFSGLEINHAKSSVHYSKVYSTPHILEIIGFPPKGLLLTYLGIPISGKRKNIGQCNELIQPLEKSLARWKGRCLSHGGTIQLVNRIFAGIFSYWVDGTTLPRSVTTKVRQLAYVFIWDEKKFASWARMILHSYPRNIEA